MPCQRSTSTIIQQKEAAIPPTAKAVGLLAEILMKDIIPVGGIWASHDIYYPKSSKHCRSTEEVENSPKWEVLEKTDSRQGLLIARKVSDGS